MVNNGTSAKKEASQVGDWGVERRGGATPFPSSHSLVKLHLPIDQLKLSKLILGSEAGRSKEKEMNYSALNLNMISLFHTVHPQSQV